MKVFQLILFASSVNCCLNWLFYRSSRSNPATSKDALPESKADKDISQDFQNDSIDQNGRLTPLKAANRARCTQEKEVISAEPSLKEAIE